MRIKILQNTPQEALLALAKYVKTVRLNQEMTIEELAIRTGVSRSSIIRFEKLGAGSTETQMRIFAVLGLLDAFLSGFSPPEKTLTIAELKKMSTGRQRQRGRKRASGIS